MPDNTLHLAREDKPAAIAFSDDFLLRRSVHARAESKAVILSGDRFLFFRALTKPVGVKPAGPTGTPSSLHKEACLLKSKQSSILPTLKSSADSFALNDRGSAAGHSIREARRCSHRASLSLRAKLGSP